MVHVPTTLMACVDSSIGGKTAVNVQHGPAQLKNIIGSFHPPSRVYIDVACIAALPPRHFNNGMAEVVKCALLASPPLYALLSATTPALIQQHPALLARVMCAALSALSPPASRARIAVTPLAYLPPSTSKLQSLQRIRQR